MKGSDKVNDDEIVDLFLNRSEQAIAELSLKYGRTVHKIAINILGNSRDAEECENDTYLACWNTIPPQRPTPLAAYVCRITRNIAIAKFHSNTALKRNGNYDAVLDELAECIPGKDTPEEEFDRKELSCASTSAMQYGGQGYINFCYFWEEGDQNILSAEREFPFIGHFVFKVDSDPDRREDRSGEQGFFISVFATFIGDLLLDLGPFGMIIWVCAFALITAMVIKRPHRKEFTIGEILLIFYLSVIPIFGIFYYRFFNYQYTIMLLLILIMYGASKYEIKLK